MNGALSAGLVGAENMGSAIRDNSDRDDAPVMPAGAGHCVIGVTTGGDQKARVTPVRRGLPVRGVNTAQRGIGATIVMYAIRGGNHGKILQTYFPEPMP